MCNVLSASWQERDRKYTSGNNNKESHSILGPIDSYLEYIPFNYPSILLWLLTFTQSKAIYRAPGHWELVFLASPGFPTPIQKSKSIQKGLNRQLSDKELNRTIL